jgi:hypothetical protein
MNKLQELKKSESKKGILENGKLFFSKETERKVFFFMTIFMLLMGVFVKLGIA